MPTNHRHIYNRVLEQYLYNILKLTTWWRSVHINIIYTAHYNSSCFNWSLGVSYYCTRSAAMPQPESINSDLTTQRTATSSTFIFGTTEWSWFLPWKSAYRFTIIEGAIWDRMSNSIHHLALIHPMFDLQSHLNSDQVNLRLSSARHDDSIKSNFRSPWNISSLI